MHTELHTKPFFILGWREDSLQVCDCISDLYLIAGIVHQSNAEVLSQLFKKRYSEVTVLIDPGCWTAEGALESETVDQVKLSPHNYSSCGLSHFLNDEVAVLETEMLRVLAEDVGKQSLF